MPSYRVSSTYFSCVCHLHMPEWLPNNSTAVNHGQHLHVHNLLTGATGCQRIIVNATKHDKGELIH